MISMTFQLFKAFGKSAIKIQMAYISMFWSGFLSNLLWLVITYSFWVAAFENNPSINHYSLQDMITYAILASTLGKYVSGMSGMLANTIRDGSIAMELMRPYHVLMKFTAWDMGTKLAIFLRETLPAFLLIACFVPFHWADWQTTLIFLGSAFLGIYIGVLLDLMIDMLSFWLVNLWGVYILKGAIMGLLSGALIPLSMFPSWVQTIGKYMPFSSMVYIPTAIYTGKLTGIEMYQAIGVQFLWVSIIISIMFLSWKSVMKRVSVFGG